MNSRPLFSLMIAQSRPNHQVMMQLENRNHTNYIALADTPELCEHLHARWPLPADDPIRPSCAFSSEPYRTHNASYHQGDIADLWSMRYFILAKIGTAPLPNPLSGSLISPPQSITKMCRAEAALSLNVHPPRPVPACPSARPHSRDGRGHAADRHGLRVQCGRVGGAGLARASAVQPDRP